MEDRQYTNTSCPLYETVYCQRLNMLSCNVCPAKNPSNAQAIQTDLDAVAQLMPAEDLAPLFHTEQCVLCKGTPGKRVCYGMTDLGNPEPKREGRNFIGMKTKLRIGSLLPIQLGCCAACRRKFQLASYAPVLTPVAAGVLSLVALGIAPVRTALAGLHAVVPLLLFVVVVGLAALLGRLWQASMLRRFEQETYMNIMEQPFLAAFKRFGWFELQREKRMSHLIFAKERLKQGMYTK